MNWLSFFEHFHFLRPYWLLAIIPLVVLALMLWQQVNRADGDWRHAIDPAVAALFIEWHTNATNQAVLARPADCLATVLYCISRPELEATTLNLCINVTMHW